MIGDNIIAVSKALCFLSFDLYPHGSMSMINFIGFQDEEHGYFGNVNEQIDQVCDKIAADPNLADGYHAMGFSQGGQFL